MQVKIVHRELVAVFTQATLTDAEMLQAQPDAAYLLALTEQQLAVQDLSTAGLSGKHVRIGICAVDVASARFFIGLWSACPSAIALHNAWQNLVPIQWLRA